MAERRKPIYRYDTDTYECSYCGRPFTDVKEASQCPCVPPGATPENPYLFSENRDCGFCGTPTMQALSPHPNCPYHKGEQSERCMVNVVFAARDCACRIIGDGTLQHPLTIKRCPLHAAAAGLRDAAKAVLDNTLACVGGGRLLRTHLVKALLDAVLDAERE